MQAARLRHWITIQQPIITRGAAGGEVVVWQDFASLHAGIEPLRSGEFFAAQQVQSQISARIRMRWMPGVTSKMRVKQETEEGDRYYAIEGPPINVENRNRELQLMCTEREANGWR